MGTSGTPKNVQFCIVVDLYECILRSFTDSVSSDTDNFVPFENTVPIYRAVSVR